MQLTINELKQQLRNCMLKDQFILGKKLSLKNKNNRNQDLNSIKSQIEKSHQRVEQRHAQLPKVSYPEDLPIADKRDEVKALINSNQVIILSGETGSGKTTQIPKICLDLGLGVKGLIGHTQPRRIAARTVATRIAEELDTSIGQSVGFKVRFSDHVSETTHIKLMTDGILLAEIQNDRNLLQYEVLIIDEAHERSLNIDFILGYIKTILPKRPDLKIIITSATIDTDQFSKHFQNAPIIEVSGRTYPVETVYRPLDQEDEQQSLVKAISNAVFELNQIKMGDILVFLPGEREIREAAEYLRKHHPPHTEILPLYSRLTVKEQQKVFQSHKGLRVVLATNVAETSLTVPGIRYVVDTGLARISRYSVRSRLQRLPIEVISQSAANQRAGRCGRLSAGICIRLFSEDDYQNRDAFTDPEILRTNLASVILQMKMLRIGDIFQFPFIQSPERKYINDGIKLLQELGAIDSNQEITEIGKTLGRFPIDPRLGRMLIEANQEGCVTELLILTAFLTIQDPRERPFEYQEKADLNHARFEDKKSDFLSVIKLWEYVNDKSKHLSQNKFRKLCKAEFLSYLRIREWKDIQSQLKSILMEIGYRLKKEEANYQQIHVSLLSGLLSNIGFKQDGSEFLGSRQKKFFIFPGSHLKSKSPKWIMAAEIVETQRNYARCVAKIEPEWIVDLAKQLVNRHYFEPHWQKKVEQVGAFEKISLYGITLIAKQRVNYGPIDPQEARKLFIRHALVQGEMNHPERFLIENIKAMENIEAMEHKSRRKDILISEDELFDLYDRLIPADVISGNSFRKWYKKEQKKNPGILKFEESQFMRNADSSVNQVSFPETLNIHGFKFDLSYNFEPGSENDGVTVYIPLGLLKQIDVAWFGWLLPGLIKEKITALIKSLPKSLRRHFVPVPDFAAAILSSATPYQKPLLTLIAEKLSSMSGLNLSDSDFDQSKLASHLFFIFALVDEDNKILGQSRDLQSLKLQYSSLADKAFQQSPVLDLNKEKIICWDFGELAETVEVNSTSGSFFSYPALVDATDSVTLQHFSTKTEADKHTQIGLLRLFKLNMGEKINYLKKNLPDIDKICLLSASLSNCQCIKNELTDLIIRSAYMQDMASIRDKTSFQAALEKGHACVMSVAVTVCKDLIVSLQSYNQCRKQLTRMPSPAYLESYTDINEQIANLIFPHFLCKLSMGNLRHIPRFLQAVLRRLEKLSGNLVGDRKHMLEVKRYWTRYKQMEESWNQSDVTTFRWMIEEYRVSLFAQELKTSHPISAKRLDAQMKRCTES